MMSSPAPVQVTGLTSGATAISVGNNYACAVVSGGVKCWGNNGFGASMVPEPVTGLTSGVTAVSVGDNTACAVVGGAAQCWGSGAFGQLGNGLKMDSAIPVAVSTLTSGVTSISVGFGGTNGSGASLIFACAVTSAGGVWCWGSNTYGSPGSVPARVTGF
jgi:alpha-tubulin suppressor-like RCC1 family protein